MEEKENEEPAPADAAQSGSKEDVKIASAEEASEEAADDKVGIADAAAGTAASMDASLLASGDQPAALTATALTTAETSEDASALAIVQADELAKEETHEFEPEPLHVRFLCKIAHRRAVRDIKDEETKWEELQRELSAASTATERKEAIHEEIKKLRYQNRLRQQRFERLNELNPNTHKEFPALLIQAARDGDPTFVTLAFEAKVDMDVQDKELQVTPLIMATISNKINVVKLLLELKANPRVQDVNGATCVHYAVQLDHVHVLAALMDANPGQDWDTLTMKDSRSMSPIDYARRPERSACYRLLQSRMGGPHNVVWQVFKGWMSDKTGCCKPHVVKKKRGCCFCCACSPCCCTDVTIAKKN